MIRSKYQKYQYMTIVQLSANMCKSEYQASPQVQSCSYMYTNNVHYYIFNQIHSISTEPKTRIAYKQFKLLVLVPRGSFSSSRQLKPQHVPGIISYRLQVGGEQNLQRHGPGSPFMQLQVLQGSEPSGVYVSPFATRFPSLSTHTSS